MIEKLRLKNTSLRTKCKKLTLHLKQVTDHCLNSCASKKHKQLVSLAIMFVFVNLFMLSLYYCRRRNPVKSDMR